MKKLNLATAAALVAALSFAVPAYADYADGAQHPKAGDQVSSGHGSSNGSGTAQGGSNGHGSSNR